jgi:hypothetical protein
LNFARHDDYSSKDKITHNLGHHRSTLPEIQLRLQKNETADWILYRTASQSRLLFTFARGFVFGLGFCDLWLQCHSGSFFDKSALPADD